MESTEELKKAEMLSDARVVRLRQWLETVCGLTTYQLIPLAGDASFRRYFRVCSADHSYVAMDAPPAQENCGPFVTIANALRSLQLSTPIIFNENQDEGFLLLSDFGDHTYLSVLNSANADQLYSRALDALANLQTCRTVPGRVIPPFTADWMWKEWAWHKEWFTEKLLGIDISGEENELAVCYARIVESALGQPQVFMHRDFHSANLMLLNDNQVGILDFQDAFIGPLTYDLVSLLRDCYIDWPPEKVTQWALYYWQLKAIRAVCQGATQAEFLRWFDWMGIQRHLKALLTFARKAVRDQQPQYLKHIPRTLVYLRTVSAQYPELAPLHDYLVNKVQPALNKWMESTSCAR